jgi:hypothetical protein
VSAIDPVESRKGHHHQHPVHPSNNGTPPATTDENVDVTDAQLYWRERPDRRLQHRALRWVGLGLVTSLLCMCVVAIAIGSVPVPLGIAIITLAGALAGIALYNFPRSDTSDGPS